MIHRSLFKVFLLFGLPYSTAMASNKNYRLLEKVVGYENRKNDLLLFGNSSGNKIVYYFGGDIQDLPEQMDKSRESRRYQRWNLVSTGEILCRRFLDSSIVVIRPNEMKDGTFSRFSNFVPSTNEYGDPLSYEIINFIGLQHLRSLDEQISDERTSTSDVTIVGFSKGCVVLNQLLHELTTLRQITTNNSLSKFASRIRRIIWLDGGHNNGEQVMIWPTNEDLVSTLSYYQIQTEVYVTPFQINSSNSYKIHHTQQYKKFIDLLRSQPTYQNKIFFSDQTPSIDKHFELLNVF